MGGSTSGGYCMPWCVQMDTGMQTDALGMAKTRRDPADPTSPRKKAGDWWRCLDGSVFALDGEKRPGGIFPKLRQWKTRTSTSNPRPPPEEPACPGGNCFSSSPVTLQHGKVTYNGSDVPWHLSYVRDFQPVAFGFSEVGHVRSTWAKRLASHQSA